jgi:hypothetical protein
MNKEYDQNEINKVHDKTIKLYNKIKKTKFNGQASLLHECESLLENTQPNCYNGYVLSSAKSTYTKIYQKYKKINK